MSLALFASFLIVFGSPYVGEIRGQIQSAAPEYYRSIVVSIVTASAVLAIVSAVVQLRRFRDEPTTAETSGHLPIRIRYSLIAAAVAIAGGYARTVSTGDPEVDMVEAFHFVEYGVASKKSRADKNPEGADIGNATSYWNRRSAQAERLFWELPADRRVRVRYEDLCSDPERELERICELVELQPLPGPYEFLSGEHHILGNRMRLSSSSEIVPDERWRTVLTEEEAEDVRRLTRRHRQTFGYA